MLLSPTLLVPHLPTLLIDQHRRHHTPMLEALAAASAKLLAAQPEVIVVLSARWLSPGPFQVDAGRHHRTLTDYPGFGVEVRYDCDGSPPLARALVEAGTRARLRVCAGTRGVDSGVSVPLHFLAPSRGLSVVPLSLADAPVGEARAWGAAIRRTLDAWPGRVAFVAGGVLSFNLHEWTLGRDVPDTAELDRQVLDALERGAWDEIPPLVARAPERARPEAKLRHLDVLRGLIGADAAGTVRCYEPSPGAGAALVEFEVAGAETVGGAA